MGLQHSWNPPLYLEHLDPPFLLRGVDCRAEGGLEETAEHVANLHLLLLLPSTPVTAAPGLLPALTMLPASPALLLLLLARARAASADQAATRSRLPVPASLPRPPFRPPIPHCHPVGPDLRHHGLLMLARFHGHLERLCPPCFHLAMVTAALTTDIYQILRTFFALHTSASVFLLQR